MLYSPPPNFRGFTLLHVPACLWKYREVGVGVGGGWELSPGAALHSGSIIDWLVVWQEALQKIRQKNTMRREVTVELSSQGFWKTGIRSDVCQVTPAKRG